MAAATSRSISAILTAAGTSVRSVCRPSRGPTSLIVIRRGMPDKGAFLPSAADLKFLQ
jgi:hypothetical protein